MTDDFSRDLYGKLWDNINNKDARVWTFLSFYGAAIALFLSGRVSDELRVLGFPFLVLLSFWAIHLVLTAEWWSVRNRLMVTQIERSKPTLYKYIPDFYMKGRFSSENINSISLFVLVVMMSSFMFISVEYLRGFESCQNLKGFELTLCSAVSRYVGLLHISLVMAYVLLLFWCMVSREKTIDDFFALVYHYETRVNSERAENVEAPTSDWPWESTENILSNWRLDRQKYCWRGWFLLAIAFVAFGHELIPLVAQVEIFDWSSLKTFLGNKRWLIIALLAFSLFIIDWYRYLHWPLRENLKTTPHVISYFGFSGLFLALLSMD